MTRRTWPPPPDPEDLRELTVDVVVRDFPEALAALKHLGLDPREHGGRSLVEAAGGRASEVLTALATALAWRAEV